MSNKIVHWELMGPDGDALKGFYGELFGWETEAVPGFNEYHMVGADSSGLAGAVGKGRFQGVEISLAGHRGGILLDHHPGRF